MENIKKLCNFWTFQKLEMFNQKFLIIQIRPVSFQSKTTIPIESDAGDYVLNGLTYYIVVCWFKTNWAFTPAQESQSYYQAPCEPPVEKGITIHYDWDQVSGVVPTTSWNKFKCATIKTIKLATNAASRTIIEVFVKWNEFLRFCNKRY